MLNKSVIFSTQIESREEEGSRKFALPLTRDYCRIVFTNLNKVPYSKDDDVGGGGGEQVWPLSQFVYVFISTLVYRS